ncbi:MAG: NAD-dependent epimerase/dehydratase family protein [Thermoplasmata archaeon]
MTKVGVTGATGYISGALVPALAGVGYDLRMVDNRVGPIRAEHPEWPVPNLDFASESGLKLLSDCDVILHLGAVSGVMACARDPEASSRANVVGTGTLIQMCLERRIPLAFASSFAVVGSPSVLPILEGAPAHPTHEYARQKAAGEELVSRLANQGNVPAVVVRQSNVYGGYRVGERYIAKGNVIQLFCQQASSGRLLVNAPGTQRRDFIHLEDVIAHWEAIARYLLAPGSTRTATTFNVASGEALSVLEVADQVRSEFARLRPTAPPVRVDVVPNPREGVELVEPGFAVDRTETERKLGVRCRFHVRDALPSIFRDVEGLEHR